MVRGFAQKATTHNSFVLGVSHVAVSDKVSDANDDASLDGWSTSGRFTGVLQAESRGPRRNHSRVFVTTSAPKTV